MICYGVQIVGISHVGSLAPIGNHDTHVLAATSDNRRTTAAESRMGWLRLFRSRPVMDGSHVVTHRSGFLIDHSVRRAEDLPACLPACWLLSLGLGWDKEIDEGCIYGRDESRKERTINKRSKTGVFRTAVLGISDRCYIQYTGRVSRWQFDEEKSSLSPEIHAWYIQLGMGISGCVL